MILSVLGMGGMGVVYAAYDPELDRKVALKLVRPGSQGSEGTARLLREAQALARLSHPNVVAVYDTGTFGKQVWLAMEFVDGVTLTEWLARKRSEGALGWREVLRVMEPAGRGLASAHQAGLLHRDFKPDNVMVGVDGRVRVMDLGLARTVDSEESLPPVEGLETISGVNGGLRVKVTQAGAILGTPAYMAPEQFLGLPVDIHADQFAFCVTLWEALSGERPFSGDTLVALLTNVTSGKYRLRAKVPRWLRQICERGIQSKTERRYASMEEVLAALRRGRRHARTRFAFIVLGITLLVVAIGFGLDFVRKQQVGAACVAASKTFETSWNPEVRQQLTDHTRDLSSKHASETLERLLPHYEDYSEQWQEVRTDICHQHKLEETWDDTTFHQALWCLEDRQMMFDDLV
ncbi:MAG: serine/threonine-protein kinase, partial [Nannocystaceae bacterium]